MTELITHLVIDSAFGPQVVIDRPLSADQSGTPSWLMGVLKPQITVYTPLGHRVVAPWGVPGPTKWPLIQVAVASVAAALVLAVLVRLARRA